MIKFIYFLPFLLLFSCIQNQDGSNKRFYDDVGVFTYKGVSVEIIYGTVKIDKDSDIIHSRAQTPNIELKINNPTGSSQILNFSFTNMRPNFLPKIYPNIGTVSLTDRLKEVLYSVEIEPQTELLIKLESFDQNGDYRFGVVGDIQSSEDGADKIIDSVKDKNLDFMILLGDMVSRPTRDEVEWGYGVTERFSIPVYMVLGNHDGQVFTNDGYPLFKKFYGRTNYHFIHKNSLFLILDSSDQNISRSVFNYAKDILSNSEESMKFISLHVPPFDDAGMRNNSFSSRYQAARFLNLLIENGVSALFAGHIHTYQEFDIEGVRNFIVGTGGGIPEELDGVGYRYIIIDGDQDCYSVEKVDLGDDD